jgi:hypothetical protein
MSETRLMSNEGNKNLEKVSSSMREDADKLGTKSRFGYFSIPHSAYLGDGFYSQNRLKSRKVEKKVIKISTILIVQKMLPAFMRNFTCQIKKMHNIKSTIVLLIK